MKTYTIEEQDRIGKALAKELRLRRDKTHPGRWQMATWGNKTNVGLFNTLLRVGEELRTGEIESKLLREPPCY